MLNARGELPVVAPVAESVQDVGRVLGGDVHLAEVDVGQRAELALLRNEVPIRIGPVPVGARHRRCTGLTRRAVSTKSAAMYFPRLK